MTINLHKAKPEDAAAVADLLQQMGYPVTPPEVETRIERFSEPGYLLLIAKNENNTVGFIALHVYHVLHLPAPEGRIVSFCVDQKIRGNGVGTNLLNEAEHYFKQNGCYKIVLNSNLKRTDTHQYYLNRGYEFTSKHFIKLIKK
jgi:GNAT superfamily N-acetyltransferase